MQLHLIGHQRRAECNHQVWETRFFLVLEAIFTRRRFSVPEPWNVTFLLYISFLQSKGWLFQ